MLCVPQLWAGHRKDPAPEAWQARLAFTTLDRVAPGGSEASRKNPGWKEALSSPLPQAGGGRGHVLQSALHNQPGTSSHDWNAVAKTPLGLSVSAHGAEPSLDPLRAVLKASTLQNPT